MLKDPLKKVRYTLNFILSEFPRMEMKFEIKEDLDAFNISAGEHEFKVPKENVLASIGDGEYYGMVRSFVEGIMNEQISDIQVSS